MLLNYEDAGTFCVRISGEPLSFFFFLHKTAFVACFIFLHFSLTEYELFAYIINIIIDNISLIRVVVFNCYS